MSRSWLPQRRWLRVSLLVAAHLWGPLFLATTDYAWSVPMVVASLVVSVLTTGSVTVPYLLHRRHGWLRALLLSSLGGALLTLPLGLLSTGASLASPGDRREVASWVFFGLVLPLLFTAGVFLPLSLWRRLPQTIRLLLSRLRPSRTRGSAGDRASGRGVRSSSRAGRPGPPRHPRAGGSSRR